MKAFATAVVFAVLAAFGASVVLDQSYQQPSYSAFSTEGTRLTDPGSNLVNY
jgi:hypothetical protein